MCYVVSRRYIPLSTADLCSWLGSPGVLVLDCSAAGNIIDYHERHLQRASQGVPDPTEEPETGTSTVNGDPTQGRSPGAKAATDKPMNGDGTVTEQRSRGSGSMGTGRASPQAGVDRRLQRFQSTESDRAISRQSSHGDRIVSRLSSADGSSSSLEKERAVSSWVMLGACGAEEILPQNAELPADVFTACLTTPLKMALRWYMMHESVMGLTIEMLDHIPGALNDRKSPLGEL